MWSVAFLLLLFFPNQFLFIKEYTIVGQIPECTEMRKYLKSIYKLII